MSAARSGAQERHLGAVRARHLGHALVVGGDDHAVDVRGLLRRAQGVREQGAVAEPLDVEVRHGIGPAARGHDRHHAEPVLQCDLAPECMSRERTGLDTRPSTGDALDLGAPHASVAVVGPRRFPQRAPPMNLADWLQGDHEPRERLKAVRAFSWASLLLGSWLALFSTHLTCRRQRREPAARRKGRSHRPPSRARERADGQPVGPRPGSTLVGVLCFEILASRTFEARGGPLLRDLRPDLPRDLSDAVQACLEMDAEWRPNDSSYVLGPGGGAPGRRARRFQARQSRGAYPLLPVGGAARRDERDRPADRGRCRVRGRRAGGRTSSRR